MIRAYYETLFSKSSRLVVCRISTKPAKCPSSKIMREQNAIYGGEIITHYHFHNFIYFDSGMVSWLLITELMCKTGKTLAELINECMAVSTPAVVKPITMSKIYQEPLRVLASFFLMKAKIDHTD